MYDLIKLTLRALERMGIKSMHLEEESVFFFYGEWPCSCKKCSPFTMRMMVSIYTSYKDFKWVSDSFRLEISKAISDYGLENEEYFQERNGKLYLVKTITLPYGEDPQKQAILQMDRFFSLSLPRAKKYIEGIPPLRDALGQHAHWGWMTPQEKISCLNCWTEVCPYTEGLAAVADRKGRYGYLNADVEVAIPCRWAHARPFSEGLAVVKDDDGRYGFIDRDGQVVIPCEWSYAESFSDGMAAVSTVIGTIGFIDKFGCLVIPCDWFHAGDFHEGKVEVFAKDVGYCILDRQGHIIDGDPAPS